jgi:agmatinase
MIFFSQSGRFALDSERGGDWVLFGVPYDSTASFNPGARFGPDSIRRASHHLEVFDCDLHVDMTEVTLKDRGNIHVRHGDPQKLCDIVQKAVSDIKEPFIALGGEHTIAYPLVLVQRPDMVLSLDAHLDLRDTYLGEPLSHACTARRIAEVCDTHIYGYRECSKREYTFLKESGITAYKASQIANIVYPEGKKIHLSIDMDVLDPSVAPNVSNPVPNGLLFGEVCAVVHEILKKNTVVSIDVCEVCSLYADRTAVMAAYILYKILALWRITHGQ